MLNSDRAAYRNARSWHVFFSFTNDRSHSCARPQAYSKSGASTLSSRTLIVDQVCQVLIRRQYRRL